jgi:hypothetical protein
VDPVKLVALIAGVFFLAFGLVAYRQFFKILGVTAGLALWVVFREPLVRLPGLRDHPGTAGVLILILFCAAGTLLVVKLRRVFVFLGGFGTGVLMSGMITAFFRGDSIFAAESIFSYPAPMDLLAGLVAGTLFLLFERFFALFLTSSVGGALCASAIGGRWTFPLCLMIGLLAQPLIFSRVGHRETEKGEKKIGAGGKGKRE